MADSMDVATLRPAAIAQGSEKGAERAVTQWVRCTRKSDGASIYVNLASAMMMSWRGNEHATAIVFARNPKNMVILVAERPDQLLRMRPIEPGPPPAKV